MESKLLLTVTEACERLSCGKTYLREELIKSGRLPTVRLGRALRVPTAAVERLVQELVAQGQAGDIQ